MNPEIKLMEIVSLSVTLGIAIYFQRVFAKRQSDQRVEKDLLIDLIGEMETALRACRDAVQTCLDEGKISSANRKTITFQLRSISNGIESVKDLMEMCEFSTKKDVKQRAEDLDGGFLNFKKAITGGGYPQQPYNSGAIADFHRTLREFRKQIHGLTLQVNRAS